MVASLDWREGNVTLTMRIFPGELLRQLGLEQVLSAL